MPSNRWQVQSMKLTELVEEVQYPGVKQGGKERSPLGLRFAIALLIRSSSTKLVHQLC